MALASKTGQVRYLKAGDAGPTGPIAYMAGEYSSTTQYTRTELSVPIVLDDDEYYLLNKIGAFKGIRPKDDYALNGNNATWVRMDNIRFAFVEILMANFAKLASAVFYGDYMFSQYGVDANGNSTNAYRQFGTDAFTPNILFNFLTGAGHLAAGNIYWDEMGEMYRRTMGRFIWRDIHDEGIDAGLIDGDDYNIDLKRGTFLDISGALGETYYVVLPSASAYPGITISFRWTLLTRSGVTHPIKCADGIWALNKDSQEFELSTTIDAEGMSGNATIQSMKKNGGYEWVADRDFSPE